MSLCQSPGCSCGTECLPSSGADLALSCLFGLGGCLQRAGAAPVRALGLRNKAVQALPSSARRAVARRAMARGLEGLSVELGPASTGDEWIAAGEQGSAAPCHGCAGASNSLSAVEDKDTRDDEELVLSQGLARALWLGQGVLVEALQGWRSCQCQGTAVAVLCPQQGSVLAHSGCLRGAAKHFLSSTAPCGCLEETMW